MMRQTITIAGSLALVSLFGYANAGYAQTVKSDAPLALGQNAVAVKAIAAKDGTFDVEITHNGKTRKFTGVKATPDGNFDLPALMELNPPAGIAGRKQSKAIRVEGKPLILPSGAAAAQAHSSNVSVKAIGNGSGTFDVQITENGKTRKVTGLKPGPKGKIEVPSGVAGHPPIIIDTTEGPNGNVSVRVEGKPLIFPSGAAAAQAQSQSVSVKAIGNGSGTFDVEITENGKTRKLTGVKAGPDGSLDIPELNDVAPAGAKISKQIKIINVDGNQSGPALSTIIENTNNEDVNIVVDGVAVSGADGHDIKPGTSVIVTTNGNGSAPKIIKSQRVVVGQPLLKNMEPGRPHPNQVYKVATTRKASKEVLIVAKLVNGKKVVSEAKLVVLSGQTAKLDAGDVWLSLRATISPAGTISVKGDAGSAKSPKGPGFTVIGLPSGGSFKYPNGASGTWEIKASVSGASAAKPGGPMFIFKAAKP
jgi:hypothetical protein